MLLRPRLLLHDAGGSRKLGFRHIGFAETEFPVLRASRFVYFHASLVYGLFSQPLFL